MKKFFLVLLLAIVSSLLLNYIVGPILASYVMNQKAGQETDVAQFTVSFRQMKVGRLVPPKVSVSQVLLKDPSGNLQLAVPTIIFDTEWQWDQKASRPRLELSLRVGGMSLDLMQKPAVQEPPQKEEAGEVVAEPHWVQSYLKNYLEKGYLQLSGLFELKSASVNVLSAKGQPLMEMQPIDITVSSDDLLTPEKWIELLFQSKLRAPVGAGLTLELPIKAKAKDLFFKGASLQASGIQLLVGGIQSFVKGASDFSTGAHNWLLSLNIKSLQDLPIPKGVIPVGKWFGGVEGSAHVVMEPGKPLSLISKMKTRNFGGDLQMKDEKYSVSGRILSDISWDVRYINNVLEAKRVQLRVDGDKLSVSAPPYFKKTRKDKFNLDLSASVKNSTLNVQTHQIQLNQIFMQLGSKISLKDNLRGIVDFKILPTSLKGIETLFPMLSKQPMTGKLHVNAKASGDFKRGLPGIYVTADPIALEGFSTAFNLRDDVQKIYAIGPVTANIKGAVKTAGKKILSGSAAGRIDLSRMELDYQGQIAKKMGERLVVNVNASKKKQGIVFNNSSVELGKTRLAVSGSVEDFVTPRLNLKMNLKNLQTSRFQGMKAWPSALKANGVVDANVSVAGVFSSELGVEKSPLKVAGDVNAKFLSVEFVSPNSEANPNTEVAGPAPSPLKTVPAFMPPWPVLKDLDLTVSSKVRSFRFNNVRASGISAKAYLKKGGASVSAKVAKVFSGSVTMKKLLVPIIWENPVIRTSISLSGVQVADALRDLDLKSFPKMRGLASGSLSVDTELPSSERFLSGMTSKGALDLTKFELKEISLTESMLQTLKKIPGVKAKKDNQVQGFKGKASVVYSLKNKVAKLDKLYMKSHINDELNLSGTVDVAGPMNLKGKLWWANPPFSGEIYECNKDKQGRMTFPIVVKTDYTAPSFLVPKQSIDALASNTLRCQKKKLAKRAETEAKKAVDKKVKQLQGDVEKEIESKLKDLFQ